MRLRIAARNSDWKITLTSISNRALKGKEPWLGEVVEVKDGGNNQPDSCNQEIDERKEIAGTLLWD